MGSNFWIGVLDDFNEFLQLGLAFQGKRCIGVLRVSEFMDQREDEEQAKTGWRSVGAEQCPDPSENGTATFRILLSKSHNSPPRALKLAHIAVSD